MCGILTYYNAAGISRKELESSLAALQKLKHRGPDGEGVTLFNIHTGKHANLRTDETPAGINCEINSINEIKDGDYHLLLGHRRLKIIDLSLAAHQPMHDVGNDIWIVFNGEIYNYLELREELKKLNHAFKSNSDTEVILEAYKQWGKDCFNRFNGMWSLVIWNNKKKELLVSNDRYGIKPLYYQKQGQELIFASEVKPLFSFNQKAKNYNMSAIHTYLDYGYINQDEHTFFKGIEKIPQAHCATIELQKTLEVRPERYYDVNNMALYTSHTGADFIEEFKYLIKDAVKLTLRSDVPLGVAISGGLDSSYILYTAANLLKNETLNTYSAIFPGKYGDESEFIQLALKGLNCHSHYVNPYEQFTFNDFEKHLTSQDYPVQGISFYADWCVSKLVKNTGVTILLNGQGADEILGGYHHHFYRYCSELISKGHIGEYKRNLKEFCQLKGLDQKKVQSIVFNTLKLRFKYLFLKPSDLHDKWAKATNLDELLRIDLFEATLPAYLESNDRNSMAFSIESRLPFLDHRLVDFSMRLPSDYKIRKGWQKWLLREAGDMLPDAIRYRKDKKGFSTPEKEWVQKYKDNFRENLPVLDTIGIEKKNSFRYYALALWVKNMNNAA